MIWYNQAWYGHTPVRASESGRHGDLLLQRRRKALKTPVHRHQTLTNSDFNWYNLLK